jgi:hypothetical protein
MVAAEDDRGDVCAHGVRDPFGDAETCFLDLAEEARVTIALAECLRDRSPDVAPVRALVPE